MQMGNFTKKMTATVKQKQEHKHGRLESQDRFSSLSFQISETIQKLFIPIETSTQKYSLSSTTLAFSRSLPSSSSPSAQ